MTCLGIKTIEELRKEASDEIGEIQADMRLARKQVREILSKKCPSLSLPPDGNDLIDCCLRCRKFDGASAAAQVDNFYKFLSELYEVVGKDISYFQPTTHNKVYYESQGYALFKHRDHLGRAVAIANYEKLPVHKYSIDKALAASVLMFRELTRKCADVQRMGMVIIYNMKGFEFGHARQFRAGMMRIIARGLQGTFPARIKGLYVVNCPKIISMTYAMIRPFLGEKIKNRMHFHGSDLTNFHEQVSPDILPHFLGGNLSESEFADLEFTKGLLSLDDYYTDLMKYGYVKKGKE